MCVYRTEEPDDFDHHAKGLKLHDIIEVLDIYKLKTKVDSALKKEIDSVLKWVRSDPGKSMNVLFDIREDIKNAILEGELTIDDFDTKDCNEYRICYEGALKWCDDYPRSQYIFDIKPIKQRSIYLTLAALLKFHKKATSASQETIAADVSEYLKESGKKLSQSKIQDVFTESNNYLK